MSVVAGALAMVLGMAGAALFWFLVLTYIVSVPDPLAERLLVAAVIAAAIGIVFAVAGLLKRDLLALLGLAFSLLAMLVLVLPAVVALWLAVVSLI